MSDYLVHYGVKGMKWRVHKARPQQMNISNMRYYGDYALSKRRQQINETGVGLDGNKLSWTNYRKSDGSKLTAEEQVKHRRRMAKGQKRRADMAYAAARGKKIAAKLWLKMQG